MVEPTRDRAVLHRLLRRDPYLHLYALGDLDEFHWPHTTWYVRGETVFLLYTAAELPVLLALEADSGGPGRELLRDLSGTLPHRLYVHVSPHLGDTLRESRTGEPHGLHLRLGRERRVPVRIAPAVRRLGPADRGALDALYGAAYPGNWFEARMLETGKYFGYFESGDLLSVAGVHVWSPRFGVAALGNIATHPRARGRGLAGAVTEALLADLGDLPFVGLNVDERNTPALRCYRRLGFRERCRYEEILTTRLPPRPTP